VSLYPLHLQSAKFSIVCAFETRLAIELPITAEIFDHTARGAMAASEEVMSLLASEFEAIQPATPLTP